MRLGQEGTARPILRQDLADPSMATMLWLRTPTASRLIIPGVLSSRDNRLLDHAKFSKLTRRPTTCSALHIAYRLVTQAHQKE